MFARRLRASHLAAPAAALAVTLLAFGGAQAQESCADASLVCAATRATEAVRRAQADPAAKPFITLSTLESLAFAQRKAGQEKPLAETVARVAALNRGDTAPHAIFLMRYASAEEGRAMLLRVAKVAEDDAAAKARERYAPMFFLAVMRDMIESGFKTEAVAAIARVRPAADAAAAAMPLRVRVAYETGLAAVLVSAGDRPAAVAVAERAWAAVKAAQAEPAEKLNARIDLLRGLESAGLVDPARAILVDVRREYGYPPVSLVAFAIAVASVDAAARRAELAAMRERRRELVEDPSGWYAGELRQQFDAALAAGERDFAAGIFADAKAASARRSVREILRWDGHVGLGGMAAALGDDAGVEAALAGLATTRRRSETDAEFRRSMVGYILQICAVYADRAGATHFYRCIARITLEEAKPYLAELAKQHVALAAALAKR